MNKEKIKNAIFDFDGTLVDSETLYTKAMHETAKKMNVLLDIDFKRFAGYQTNDMYDIISKTHKIPDNFFEENKITFDKMIDTELELFEGVVDTIKKFKNIVIASNSNIEYVEKIAKLKDIHKYIKNYSCHNEKLKAKPEPDLFLDAFANLQKIDNETTIENTIIFEDSIAGVQAAKKTKIKVVAITNSYSKEELIQEGADIVIDNINEVFKYIDIV